MNRRSFLYTAGAATLGVAVASCRAPSASDARALARPELLARLGEAPVRAIGASYRATRPAEGNADQLRRAILASRPVHARLFGASGPSLAEMVRDDFARGRTVVVDGWILSVTEARQCALFSLLAA